MSKSSKGSSRFTRPSHVNNYLTTNTELGSTLNKLSISPQQPKSPSASKKKQDVAESWEDEDSGDDTDRPNSRQQSHFPAAPPPTPISPSISSSDRDAFISPYGYGDSLTPNARSERPAVRPEKTDAVAKRMIAGALGVKAPKQTEEQKAYDRAVKEKETRRRNLEKQVAAKAEEEAENAKAAVWND
jgi:hypothetical protein